MSAKNTLAIIAAFEQKVKDLPVKVSVTDFSDCDTPNDAKDKIIELLLAHIAALPPPPAPVAVVAVEPVSPPPAPVAVAAVEPVSPPPAPVAVGKSAPVTNTKVPPPGSFAAVASKEPSPEALARQEEEELRRKAVEDERTRRDLHEAAVRALRREEAGPHRPPRDVLPPSKRKNVIRYIIENWNSEDHQVKYHVSIACSKLHKLLKAGGTRHGADISLRVPHPEEGMSNPKLRELTFNLFFDQQRKKVNFFDKQDREGIFWCIPTEYGIDHFKWVDTYYSKWVDILTFHKLDDLIETEREIATTHSTGSR